MRRWWWPYVLAAVALVLSILSLWRSYHTSKAVDVVHRMAATEPASPSYYANERGAGRFHLMDPLCGAVGDDAADDTAAINQCNAAAQAVNGTVVVDSPAVAFKVTSEIPIHWPAHWTGPASQYQQATIRAHGSGIRSVLEIRTSFAQQSISSPGPTDLGVTSGTFEGFTVDANLGAARQAILLNGTSNTSFKRLNAINAVGSCVRNVSVTFPPTLGTIIQGGTAGSPTGVTAQIADQNYFTSIVLLGINGAGVAHTLTIKVSAGGTLGTATYIVQLDSGSFSSLPLPINSQIQLMSPDVPLQVGTGILVNFPAGTYNAGTTYAIPFTPQGGDYGPGANGGPNTVGVPYSYNDSLHWERPTFGYCGTTYTTAGLNNKYGGSGVTVVGGTAATTAGSQIVVGTGTHWLTQQGDCSWGRGVFTTDATIFYPLLAVLDDTHLAVGPDAALVPATTASGLNYAMACTAAYYEDQTTKDGGYALWVDGAIGVASIGAIFSNNYGPHIDKLRFGSDQMAAALFGGGTYSLVTGSLLSSVQTGDSATSNHAVTYLIGSTSSGTMMEPTGNFVVGGLPVRWSICTRGTCGAVSAPSTAGWYVNTWSQSWVPLVLTVSSASQQIAAPETQFLGQAHQTPSYIELLPQGDYLMTATPTVLPVSGAQPGTVLILVNGAPGHTITFQDNYDTSSGLLLEGRAITLDYEDALMLQSTVVPQYEKWQQVGPVVHGYRRQGTPLMGNLGQSKFRLVTTNNTQTTVPGACVTLSPNFGTNAGTGFKLDVLAQSHTTTSNNAWWLDYAYGWDMSGAAAAANPIAGLTFGTGAGHTVPSPGGSTWSWALVGTNPACIAVTGDNTANAVTWTIVMTHRDPGF